MQHNASSKYAASRSSNKPSASLGIATSTNIVLATHTACPTIPPQSTRPLRHTPQGAPSAHRAICSPGVATSMSGFSANSANCASMASPPTSTAVRRSVPRPSSRTTLCVCSASSRVGARMTARAPARGVCAFSLGCSRSDCQYCVCLCVCMCALSTMKFEPVRCC